ncbi:MAG TPA: VWA domain-containing protein [Terriglobales bacterium]|nr:VWA domain-containing protein [Terriglobales bacterium]
MFRAIQHGLTAALVATLWPSALFAQAPEGPLPPTPGTTIQQPPPAAQAKIISRVTLVNTPVTVRNSKGEMVTSLGAGDFHLTDQGIPQNITHFDVGGDPVSLVVLYETSSNIEPLLPELRKTGILITDTVMGPTGEAAIIGFNDSVDHLLEFTSNADKIQDVVTHLKLGTSGVKLYDAMAAGVEMLSDRPEATPHKPGRRRVLLVISEATDQGSESQLGEVLRQAQLANVTIYSVGLSSTRAMLQAKPQQSATTIAPPGTYPLPPIPGEPPIPVEEDPRVTNTIDLMALAKWAVIHAKDKVTGNPLEVADTATGGMHVATFKNRSIERAIDEIGGELHAQYTLSYTPTGTSNTGYHEIKVSLDRSNLKVRARPGYYLAPPES